MLEARVRWAEQELLDRDEELRIARARAADAESVAESAERAARAREAAWRAEEARLRHALGGLMDEVEERFSGGGGPPPRAGGRGERLLEGGYSYAGNGGGGNWYGGYGGCGNGGGGSGGGRNGYGGYGGYDGGGGSSYIGGGVELTAETADGRSLYNKAVIDEIRNRPTPPPPPTEKYAVPTHRYLRARPSPCHLVHRPVQYIAQLSERALEPCDFPSSATRPSCPIPALLLRAEKVAGGPARAAHTNDVGGTCAADGRYQRIMGLVASTRSRRGGAAGK